MRSPQAMADATMHGSMLRCLLHIGERGGSFDMPVGGKTDNLHGKPVRIRGKVKSLHNGEYLETEIRHGGGRYFNQGATAVIEAEGSTRDEKNLLVLNTSRVTPFRMMDTLLRLPTSPMPPARAIASRRVAVTSMK